VRLDSAPAAVSIAVKKQIGILASVLAAVFAAWGELASGRESE
jgi:hypothetical protein